MNLFQLLLAAVLVCATVAQAQTFHNPVLDTEAGDPYVYLHTDGYYYFTFTVIDSPDLYVYKSKVLSDWRSANRSLVYTTPEGFYSLWAPEIHFIDGNWYIYFAMDDGRVENHRMFVIQAMDPSDPLGQYTPAKRIRFINELEDYYAIDGTVMKYTDGRLYFLYSGCKENRTTWPQNIFIAPMSDPTTISGSRVLIREPTAAWESGLNEGPEVMFRENRTVVVISSSCGDYCLGLMGIDFGADPMNASNWWHKRDEPIFSHNTAGHVFSPGHASFTYSPDRTEEYIMYHAIYDLNGGWHNRTARIQKFTWNEDNTPRIPEPIALTEALPVPSGEV